MRLRLSGRLVALLVLGLGGLAAPAWAMEPEVVLVQVEADAEANWPEALSRAESELMGMGFIVVRVQVTPKPGEEWRSVLETAADERDAVAAAGIRRVGASVELWVLDRVTEKLSVRNVSPKTLGRKDAALLAGMQLVELLHASLVEIRTREAEPKAAPPPAIIRDLVEHDALPVPPPSAPPRRFTTGASVALLWFPSQVSTSIGPELRLGFEPWEGTGLVAEGLLSGTQSAFASGGSQAGVALHAVRLGVTHRFGSSPWLGVRAALSGAAILLRSVGRNAAGVREERWAGLPAVSGRVEVEWTPVLRPVHLSVHAGGGVDCIVRPLTLTIGADAVGAVQGCPVAVRLGAGVSL